MDLQFKQGDKVSISDMEHETAQVAGKMVRDFESEGEVVETRRHPPHVPDDQEDDELVHNLQPHYLVKMKDKDGNEHNVWFHEARLSGTGGSDTRQRKVKAE